MDCNCNCFGIAASSKFPVKRYNLLVPDIFPRKSPVFAECFDAATERKYKKLYEYVDKNPHRGEKVSRRLARKIYQDLRSQRHGNVQIAANAYIYLLHHLPSGNSSLLAREVVLQHVDKEKGRMSNDPKMALSSVVGTLLQSSFLEIRILGARLLAAFVRIQSGLDYAQQLQSFVPLLCDSLPGTSRHLVSLRGQESSKAATADLAVACLGALQEYILFSSRTSSPSTALEQPARRVLDYLAAEAPFKVPLKNGDTEGAQTDEAAISQTPDIVAAAVQYIRELFALCKDTVEGRRLIAFTLRYLDEKQLWGGKALVAAGVLSLLEKVCHQEGQDFLLFSAVLQHLHAEPRPSAAAQAALLQRVRAQAAGLQTLFAIPALISCLKELPGVMAPTETIEEFPYVAEMEPAASSGMTGECLGLVHELAAAVGNSTHVLESVGGISARYLADNTTAEQATDCFMAAVQGVSRDGGAVVGPIFPKPLAQLLAAAMAARSWPVPRRLKAHALGRAAAALTEGHLRDGHQLLLWSAAWVEVAADDGTPAVFASLDALLAALVRLASPDALVAALRWALSLRSASLQEGGSGHLASIGPARRLTLLFLHNALLARLAAALGAPKLSALLLPLVASNCPHLQLTKAGLRAADTRATYTAADDEKAVAVLASLYSKEQPSRDLAAKAASSLELSPCLRGTHLADHLSEELQKPFQAMSFDAMGRHMADESSSGNADLAARLNAIFAAEAPINPTFVLTDGLMGMPQAAGPEMEGENGAPVIDLAELLAAVDRLTQNGSAIAAE